MMAKETLRLTFLGDILPGELPYTIGYGIRSQFKQHQGTPWIKKIKQFTGESDITIANLECPLISEADAIKNTFYGEPEFAKFLNLCGVNILNIANNHILEQGENGINSTIKALEKESLSVIGYLNESKSKVYIHEIKNRRIGFGGFCSSDIGKIENMKYIPALSIENCFNALDEMNERKADLKILSLHWGNEYINIPSFEQRKMAYKLIDEGADIIFGHHPHVFQPYEKYNNGHIFYSLGNFIFDYNYSDNVSIGLIVHINLDNNDVINPSFEGVFLSYRNTISSIPDFQIYYRKVDDMYQKLLSMSDHAYSTLYESLLKRNRFYQRLMMKFSIIKELSRISNRDKKYLLHNLMKYYLGKIDLN